MPDWPCSIHFRIGENASATYEQKELVLEVSYLLTSCLLHFVPGGVFSLQSLVDFCKEPSLIVGLYRNYDCEVGSTNLFEGMPRRVLHRSLPL
jgi:hypothetical protein